MHSFDYHRPSTLKEAATLLKKTENARALGGGQSLVPTLKMRLANTPALVDLGAISELRNIKLEAATLTVGAGMRHSEVAASKDVMIGIPALALFPFTDPKLRSDDARAGVRTDSRSVPPSPRC